MGEEANGEDTAAEASAGPATLRDFVVANFPLLTAVGAFTGLATFVSVNAQGLPWLATALRFLFVVAAALLALELVAQLPPDARLHRARVRPGQPWRLVAFAYVGQLAMLGALLNVFWQYPRLLAPTLVLAVGVLLWRVVPDHVKGRAGAPILVAAAALLVAGLIVALLWQERGPIDALWERIR
jgi:hypothetical protein